MADKRRRGRAEAMARRDELAERALGLWPGLRCSCGSAADGGRSRRPAAGPSDWPAWAPTRLVPTGIATAEPAHGSYLPHDPAATRGQSERMEIRKRRLKRLVRETECPATRRRSSTAVHHSAAAEGFGNHRPAEIPLEVTHSSPH